MDLTNSPKKPDALIEYETRLGFPQGLIAVNAAPTVPAVLAASTLSSLPSAGSASSSSKPAVVPATEAPSLRQFGSTML